VRKIGAEAAIAHFADDEPLVYGLLTVALSVGMGWIAGRFLSRG
jgi:hypothetical protein